MRFKEDIYNRPKTPFSEYINYAVVTIIAVVFMSFEVYAHFFKEPVHIATIFGEKIVSNSAVVPVEKNETLNIVQEPVIAQKVTHPKVVEKKADISKVETPSKAVVIQSESTVVEQTLDQVIAQNDKALLYKVALAHDASQYDNEHKVLGTLITSKTRLSEEEKKVEVTQVSALIEKGYKLNADYAEGNALIRNRHYDMAILLIEKSMLDVNMKNIYGYSLLHESSAKGHIKLIELLLNKGADINVQAIDGASVLHYPTLLGFRLTVDLLLKRGIDPNLTATLKYPGVEWNGDAPLHVASKKANIAIVKLLIESAADVHLKNADGKIALDLARENNMSEVVTILEAYEGKATLGKSEAPPVVNNISDDVLKENTDHNSSVLLEQNSTTSG